MDGEFWEIFRSSKNAMLLLDDDRRYIAANDAAERLLGVGESRLRAMRADDFAQSANGDLDAIWSAFRRRGSMTGRWRIRTARGETEVEYSATTDVLPGRHLSIILAPAPAELEEPSTNGHEPLTVREREVVRAIAEGHTTGQIAGLLYLSPATIETHVRKAMLRLGARNRAHLIALALQRGEI